MDYPIDIAVTDRKNNRKYKNQHRSWAWLEEKNSNPVRTTESTEEYRKLPKAKRDDIKDHGGCVPGMLRGGSRKAENVIELSLGMLDGDHIPAEVSFCAGVKDALPHTLWHAYTTHSHTPETQRYRLAVAFNRKVKPDEYPPLMRKLAQRIGIDYFDPCSYEANRMMFWPSCPSDGVFDFQKNAGEPLDIDAILAEYDDWRDVCQWPTCLRESEAVKHEIKRQQDPLVKEGVVGAFCRSYSIEDAIEAFLSDVYEPSAVDGRYDYIPADSAAGVVLYDGKFAYSHHATDPASGHLLNAFDLVRIHRFRDLDDRTAEDTPPGRLPSFKAMASLAVQDERVNTLLLEERRVRAAADFAESSDWTKGLERDRSGLLLNNLHNITLILENDPALKAIVFNQLADGMEIQGEVPWKHRARFWRDADDAQLISYVDSHYGTFSARNYNIAVAKVTDDRSYHPIRDYLDALPPWDGMPRLENLLIRYLGADNNRYVRAVTRKAFCAAIARVLEPGIKFDNILVMNGAQGVGKSTLLSKLGMDWYSDSLSLTDMNDKTAAEKLQGYWILEIGELAGMRKADIDKVKAFISRQDDKYRASFGRRVTPHPRQCIFIGTTNSDKGYLRDITGNRRFWTVKTPGSRTAFTWQLTDEDVQQIWAETLVLVKAGERLYLDADLEKIARSEQRDAMEQDDREGLVREYLDTLLPENWSDLNLPDRRLYIEGCEFGTPQGSIKRQKVSNLEIWCECFRKDRTAIRKQDSYDISAIMSRIGGWAVASKRARVSIYGIQQIWERVAED